MNNFVFLQILILVDQPKYKSLARMRRLRHFGLRACLHACLLGFFLACFVDCLLAYFLALPLACLLLDAMWLALSCGNVASFIIMAVVQAFVSRDLYNAAIPDDRKHNKLRCGINVSTEGKR